MVTHFIMVSATERIAIIINKDELWNSILNILLNTWFPTL
jgi:hypothetical protein